MKQRLNYIDALRGLTMISVVMVHVLVRSFGLNPATSGLAVIRATFTLPLFFCISGFFAWRPPAQYSLPMARKAVTTRVAALLLGTALFDTLFLIFSGKPNPFAWINGDFDSYWYTFTLLQIFIFYIATVMIARLFRTPRLSMILLIIMGAAGFIAHYFIDYTHYRHFWLCAPKTAEYMQFFVIGCLIRSAGDSFFTKLADRRCLSAILVTYTASVIAHYHFGADLKSVSIWLFRLNNDLLSRYAGLLLVLWIFYTLRDKFDSRSPFIRGWRFIGTRTLDIYFLHYLLLPQMRWVGPFLTKGNTLLLQLVSGLTVALAVIAVALAISWVIRKAPYISLLVGEKNWR